MMSNCCTLILFPACRAGTLQAQVPPVGGGLPVRVCPTVFNLPGKPFVTLAGGAAGNPQQKRRSVMRLR